MKKTLSILPTLKSKFPSIRFEREIILSDRFLMKILDQNPPFLKEPDSSLHIF